MQLTGAGALGVQVARQLLAGLRPLIPDAPESFWREYQARLDPDVMIEKVIPVYQKHLSALDVKELIAFYESRVGRKLVREQQGIVQESMAAGQEWGREVAESIVRAARARGFQVKDI
jgi:hypothetical protein